MRPALALLLAPAMGCAACSAPMYVDDQVHTRPSIVVRAPASIWTADELDAASEAAQMWTAALRTRSVTLLVGECNAVDWCLARAPGLGPLLPGSDVVYVAAQTVHEARTITVWADGTESWGGMGGLLLVLRHEMGHALSTRSGHLPPGNTMAPSAADEPDHLTAADVGYANGF